MTKIEPCDCDLRKKIEITITDVKEEAVCGVPDSALIDVLDFFLEGPKDSKGKQKPVLRIRYCPWCRGSVPKPERITHLEGTDEDPEEDESWRGTSGE